MMKPDPTKDEAPGAIGGLDEAAKHGGQQQHPTTPAPQAAGTWRPDLKAHKLALRIPEMLQDEYVGLVADIKAHGLRLPIVLYEGMILDGRHRARACVDLGIVPKVEPFNGTEADAWAFVQSINAHRRHLTLEAKQKIIEAELKRDPKQSDRQAAKKANASPTTAGKVRAKLEAAGELSTVDRSVGADGKVRPRKPATKPSKRERQGLPPAPPPLPKAEVIAQRIGAPELVPIIEGLDAQIKTNSTTHRPEVVAALADQLELVLVKWAGGTLAPEYAAIVANLKECGQRHRAAASPGEVALLSHKLKKLLLAASEPAQTAAANESPASVKREWNAAQAEAATLSETAKAKFDRIVKKAQAALQQEFQVECEKHKAELWATVDERVAATERRYRDLLAEAELTTERNQTIFKTLDRWMTEEEFKLVLGCLHPDRQPEDQRAKYDKAFQIFKRLEAHLDPSKRALRKNDWPSFADMPDKKRAQRSAQGAAP